MHLICHHTICQTSCLRKCTIARDHQDKLHSASLTGAATKRIAHQQVQNDDITEVEVLAERVVPHTHLLLAMPVSLHLALLALLESQDLLGALGQGLDY